MDTVQLMPDQTTACNVVLIPPPTSNVMASNLGEQTSVITQEYRKIYSGVADFVQTVAKTLQETDHKSDGDRLSKLLSNLGSFPLSSEAELTQHASKLTVTILTAFAVIAEIVKTVVKQSTSTQHQAVSSEQCAQFNVKMEQEQSAEAWSPEYPGSQQPDVSTLTPTSSVLQQEAMRMDCSAELPHSQRTLREREASLPSFSLETGLSMDVHRNSENETSFSSYRHGASDSDEQGELSDMGDGSSDSDYKPSKAAHPQGKGPRRKGRPRKPLTCDYCPQKFKNRRHVWNHMDQCHRDLFRPDAPQHQNTDQRTLDQPVGVLSKPHLSVTSKTVNEETMQKTAAKKSRGQMNKSLTCEYCSQTFNSRTHLTRHINSCHREQHRSRLRRSQKKGKDSRMGNKDRTKNDNVLSNRDSSLQTCRLECGGEGSDGGAVVGDDGEEAKEVKPKEKKGRPRLSRWCDFCPKVFTQRYSALVHMRTVHSKEMNWTPKSCLCSECGKSCQTPTMLKSHMKRHRGIRDFLCTNCPRSFFTQGELKNHIESVHLELRPFLCPLCGSAFKRKYALNCHMRAHSEERQHTCSVCGKAFKEPHQLSRHLTLHSSERPYECQFCHAKYGHKSALQVHLKRSKACPGSEAVNQGKTAN